VDADGEVYVTGHGSLAMFGSDAPQTKMITVKYKYVANDVAPTPAVHSPVVVFPNQPTIM
jgi:hypothetical protein